MNCSSNRLDYLAPETEVVVIQAERNIMSNLSLSATFVQNGVDEGEGDDYVL